MHFPGGNSSPDQCPYSCCTMVKGIRELAPQSIATFYTDLDSNYDPSKAIDNTFGQKVMDIQIKAEFSKHVSQPLKKL